MFFKRCWSWEPLRAKRFCTSAYGTPYMTEHGGPLRVHLASRSRSIGSPFPNAARDISSTARTAFSSSVCRHLHDRFHCRPIVVGGNGGVDLIEGENRDQPVQWKPTRHVVLD